VLDWTTILAWSKSCCLSEFPLALQEGLEFVEQMNREVRYGKSVPLKLIKKMYYIWFKEAVGVDYKKNYDFALWPVILGYKREKIT